VLFSIHLALVSIYYFLAAEAHGYNPPSKHHPHYAVTVEVGVVAATFVLYTLWEVIAAVSLKSLKVLPEKDVPVPGRVGMPGRTIAFRYVVREAPIAAPISARDSPAS
jgi:hypothetical protein